MKDGATKSKFPPREGDLPFAELAARGQEILAGSETVTLFFKFTCENCGARQTFTEPNTLYTSGHCEECGHVTQLTHGGFVLLDRAS